MLWSEFRKKYSDDVYTKAKQICEEQHAYKSYLITPEGKNCRLCYAKEGKYCFPCDDVKKEFLKKYNRTLDIVLA